MKIYFDHAENESEHIITFYFKPASPFAYTAGQYIELTLRHDHPDDRGEKRWFTLSSSPTDEFLTITTRITPEKGSSFKKALVNLSGGEELNISGPFGDFVLPKIVQTPLIFVAGGVGITPFHSIFTWLSQTKEDRPIKFIYGVRHEEDIIFQETLEKANQHATIVVSEPSPSWGGEQGNLKAELINGIGEPDENSLIYVSGPEPMVIALKKDLVKQGIEESQVVTDEFPNYPEI
jgi:ferredoxin-NADP reductase